MRTCAIVGALELAEGICAIAEECEEVENC